jgi:hypothetical protein
MKLKAAEKFKAETNCFTNSLLTREQSDPLMTFYWQKWSAHSLHIATKF